MTPETATYETPKLTVVGSLEEVTLGHSNGNKLDNTFPTGTPGNQLTFS